MAFTTADLPDYMRLDPAPAPRLTLRCAHAPEGCPRCILVAARALVAAAARKPGDAG